MERDAQDHAVPMCDRVHAVLDGLQAVRPADVYQPIAGAEQHRVAQARRDDATMLTILAHGTAAQKEKYLRPLVDGEARICFSMTEKVARDRWYLDHCSLPLDLWIVVRTAFTIFSSRGVF